MVSEAIDFRPGLFVGAASVKINPYLCNMMYVSLPGDESPRDSNWTYSDDEWKLMTEIMEKLFDSVSDLRDDAWEKYDIWLHNKERKQLKKNIYTCP